MKIVVRIAQAVVALSILFLLVGLLLPESQTVTRKILIDAPVSKVYEMVNGARAFHSWSPWAPQLADDVVSWTGPERGEGSGMKWHDPHMGEGSWVITHTEANRRVDIALDFGGNAAQAWFELSPEPGGTLVIWGFHEEAGINPVHRWFGLMLDQWVGGDFEKGLKRLKEKAEGRSELPA